MKIAQIAQLHPTSDPCAGEVERVAACLSRQLVVEGHDVTFVTRGLASGQEPVLQNANRKESGELVQLLEPGGFDLVHVHGELLDEACLRELSIPVVGTFYRYPHAADILSRKLTTVPVVAVSHHQRASHDHANWQATIPCGLSHALARFRVDPEDYLAYVGPIAANGGIERAVAIAAGSNSRLCVAGPLRGMERQYFNRVILPLIERTAVQVEFVGERGDADSVMNLLGRARALLVPTEWPEPCPLALLDALACGTPIIAWSTASMPEMIEHEVSGFLIESAGEGVDAVARLDQLNRLACRRAFDERFAIRVIARRYLELYRHLQRSYDVSRVVATGQWVADRELTRR
jgi:glycosyltransferase involved in cell wall biosynthesis